MIQNALKIPMASGFDRFFPEGGFKRDELVVFAAAPPRPSLLRSLLGQRQPMVVSLEMNKQDVQRRLDCISAPWPFLSTASFKERCQRVTHER